MKFYFSGGGFRKDIINKAPEFYGTMITPKSWKKTSHMHTYAISLDTQKKNEKV